MKKTMIMLLVVSLFLIACTASGPESINEAEAQTQTVEELDLDSISESVNSVDADQNGVNGFGPGEETHQSTISFLSDSELTSAEIEGIKFMLEEEKLARDVYLYLADLWNMNIFSNISQSEDAHMEAVSTLINFFDIDDPVQNNSVGVFTNQDLQALYDELIAQGSLSLADALMVGGAIEEIDILDLQDYLAMTSNSAVIEVYENLLMGSINHLQSFARTYERQAGEEYQPQFLNLGEYQELISSSTESNMGQGNGMSATRQGKGRANQ